MIYEDITESLIEKLHELTEFQSFTVYRMIVEYWNYNIENRANLLSSEDGDNEEEIISTIFNIK